MEGSCDAYGVVNDPLDGDEDPEFRHCVESLARQREGRGRSEAVQLY